MNTPRDREGNRNTSIYDATPGSYRQHKVVATPSGSSHVHSVIFESFDKIMSVFHETHVHWTRAFEYLHAHPEQRVVAVTWMSKFGFQEDGRSWAGWIFNEQTGLYKIRVGSYDEVLREELYVCNDCAKTVEASDIAVLGCDQIRRCGACDKKASQVPVERFA